MVSKLTGDFKPDTDLLLYCQVCCTQCTSSDMVHLNGFEGRQQCSDEIARGEGFGRVLLFSAFAKQATPPSYCPSAHSRTTVLAPIRIILT